MLNSIDKLTTLQKIKNIENKLLILKTFNINENIIDELLLFCQSYDNLSVEEIHQSEETLQKLYKTIKSNKNLPVNFKTDFLTIIKELQLMCSTLIVNTIIDLI
jgi:hypothetical protein